MILCPECQHLLVQTGIEPVYLGQISCYTAITEGIYWPKQMTVKHKTPAAFDDDKIKASVTVTR